MVIDGNLKLDDNGAHRISIVNDNSTSSTFDSANMGVAMSLKLLACSFSCLKSSSILFLWSTSMEEPTTNSLDVSDRPWWFASNWWCRLNRANLRYVLVDYIIDSKRDQQFLPYYLYLCYLLILNKRWFFSIWMDLLKQNPNMMLEVSNLVL